MKIKEHRQRMGYSNSKFAIETKLKEELLELFNEIDIPTSNANLRKELCDVTIMINALCELRGWEIEEVIDYGIAINESRMVK